MGTGAAAGPDVGEAVGGTAAGVAAGSEVGMGSEADVGSEVGVDSGVGIGSEVGVGGGGSTAEVGLAVAGLSRLGVAGAAAPGFEMVGVASRGTEGLQPQAKESSPIRRSVPTTRLMYLTLTSSPLRRQVAGAAPSTTPRAASAIVTLALRERFLSTLTGEQAARHGTSARSNRSSSASNRVTRKCCFTCSCPRSARIRASPGSLRSRTIFSAVSSTDVTR